MTSSHSNKGNCPEHLHVQGAFVSTRSPYDVLGIRPNAGRDEIELAYKGRRSQYHPDRYAQADAETQAWANACMQEVNAA